jgi:putative tricarboxylic transport membrane protein
MDRRADLALASVVTAFGALLIIFTSMQNPGPTFDPLGKQGLPYAVGVFILVVGLVLVGRRLRTWQAEPSNIVWDEGSEDEEGHPASFLRAAAVMGLTLAYAIFMPELGFLIGTPIYLVVGFWVMRARKWWMLGIMPFAFTVVMFVVFNNVLSVPLPVGPLNDVLVSLGWIEAVR